MAHLGHTPVTRPTASLACRAWPAREARDLPLCLRFHPCSCRTHLGGRNDRITGMAPVLGVVMETPKGRVTVAFDGRSRPGSGVYFRAWGASASARDRATPKRPTCLGGRTGSADPRGRSIGGASAPGE